MILFFAFGALVAASVPLLLGMTPLPASFRSLPLALAVIGLNLLSAGAAFGVLTAVFQITWAEGLLDFTSSRRGVKGRYPALSPSTAA